MASKKKSSTEPMPPDGSSLEALEVLWEARTALKDASTGTTSMAVKHAAIVVDALVKTYQLALNCGDLTPISSLARAAVRNRKSSGWPEIGPDGMQVQEAAATLRMAVSFWLYDHRLDPDEVCNGIANKFCLLLFRSSLCVPLRSFVKAERLSDVHAVVRSRLLKAEARERRTERFAGLLVIAMLKACGAPHAKVKDLFPQ
jgi:hypothetical protein